jgi:hypothetical protein
VPALSRDDILRLLDLLNVELRRADIQGDIHVAGGAVMCLAFKARDSTRDIDALCKPSIEIREAVLRVAHNEGLTDQWLNDAVKGYLSDNGTFNTFLELSNLRVFCADAKYMLAMKCLAMRMGEGFSDEADVRYLLHNLGIQRYEDALSIIEKYYPLDKFPPQAIAALKELLPLA